MAVGGCQSSGQLGELADSLLRRIEVAQGFEESGKAGLGSGTYAANGCARVDMDQQELVPLSGAV